MKKKIVFVDMDGTIIAPIFKTDTGWPVFGFPGRQWIEYCNKMRDHTYDECLPVTPVLERVEKLVDNGYDAKILTVTLSEGERIAKKEWLNKNERYARFFSEIIFLDKIEDKIPYILDRIKGAGIAPYDCMIIEDHYHTILEAINAGIGALHISHIIAPM